MSQTLAAAGLASSAWVLCGGTSRHRQEPARADRRDRGRRPRERARGHAVRRAAPSRRCSGSRPSSPPGSRSSTTSTWWSARAVPAPSSCTASASMDEVMRSARASCSASTNAPGIDPARDPGLPVRRRHRDQGARPGGSGADPGPLPGGLPGPRPSAGWSARPTAPRARNCDLARRAPTCASEGRVTTEAVLAAVAQGRFAADLTTGVILDRTPTGCEGWPSDCGGLDPTRAYPPAQAGGWPRTAATTRQASPWATHRSCRRRTGLTGRSTSV